MKSVYITTTAHPFDDVRVTHRLGRSFIENGFDVSWFGPSPSIEVGPLYGIKYYFFKNNSRLDRYIAWIRLKRILENHPPADVYFAVDPDSARVANKIAAKFNKRSVFDIHEIFHRDMLYLHNFNKLGVKVFGSIIKHQIKSICEKASLVVGVGETRLRPYNSRMNESMVVRHCVPKVYAKDFLAEPLKRNTNEVLIMQGKVSQHQGTLKMLLAAKMASEKLGYQIKIVLFKIFSRDLTYEKFREYINKNGLENFYLLLEPLPFQDMFPLLSKCDIGVISYQAEMGRECMPNRIFEYLSVGLPVIVPNYAVEMVKIIDTYHCGVSVNMESPEDISANLIQLISNPELTKEMGFKGRRAFENGCNWEEEVKDLLRWIQKG